MIGRPAKAGRSVAPRFRRRERPVRAALIDSREQFGNVRCRCCGLSQVVVLTQRLKGPGSRRRLRVIGDRFGIDAVVVGTTRGPGLAVEVYEAETGPAPAPH